MTISAGMPSSCAGQRHRLRVIAGRIGEHAALLRSAVSCERALKAPRNLNAPTR